MYIEIEDSTPVDNDFTYDKGKGPVHAFTRSQNMLMFKDSSKYPDKYLLNLVFGSSVEEQKSVSSISKGLYFLSDHAFFLNMNDRGNAACDFSKLEPITIGSIDSRIKILNNLKALIKT